MNPKILVVKHKPQEKLVTIIGIFCYVYSDAK